MSNRLARLPLPTGATLPAWFAAHGPTVLAGVLVLVIAAQLASLVWRLVAPAPPPATTAGAMAMPAAPRPLDLGAIVNAHLFGSSAPAASSSDAPATSLNLVLAGTMAGRDPDQGWAIIGDTPQTAKVYATGAALPGGARLLSVYADRVILERGGVRESLLLPRLSGGGGAVPTAYTPPPVDGGASSLADSVRRLVAQDPAAASELLRPQPVFAGGQQRGYRVYPGRDRQRFAKTGLQPGDLVTEVNGVPLTDPERGLESLRGIDGGGTVNLTVERNGQSQQLTITPSTLMPATQAPIPNAAPPVSGAPPAAPPESTQ